MRQGVWLELLKIMQHFKKWVHVEPAEWNMWIYSDLSHSQHWDTLLPRKARCAFRCNSFLKDYILIGHTECKEREGRTDAPREIINLKPQGQLCNHCWYCCKWLTAAYWSAVFQRWGGGNVFRNTEITTLKLSIIATFSGPVSVFFFDMGPNGKKARDAQRVIYSERGLLSLINV